MRQRAWRVAAVALAVFLVGGSALQFGWALVRQDIWAMLAGAFGVVLGTYMVAGAWGRSER